jgi:O-antigen ligase/polysaccharide polymerase Wzy-like membrane protein
MANYTSTAKTQPLRDWFKYHFIEQKFGTWPGIFIFGLLSAGIAYATVLIDYKLSFVFTGIFITVLVFILFMKYPYFGFFFVIAYSALPSTLSRLSGNDDIPFGSLTDLLIYITLFSVISRYDLRKRVDARFWRNPIFTVFLMLFFYYILEAVNPSMFNILGWVSFIRKFFAVLCFFYISYALLNTWKATKFFINFSIIFTTLLAIYACKQQWFGMADFEMNYIMRTKGQLELLLQGGLLRKFSTLSDPASTGILFASVAVQCIILFLRETKTKTRIWLAIAIMFNLLGYGYSGTRTATLMIVAGIAFYSVATLYEKRTLIFVGLVLVAFTVLMTMPFNPPAIGRIRSTFTGTKDASALVRDINRHRVQPYLYSHPIGGGIFTAITEGPKYNPGHYLSTFPPDSGYMKVFAEQGYIGLLLMLISYFVIMRYGLNNFYKARDPEIQNQCIALLTLIFTLMVGQYSQFAMGIEPQIYFYLGTLIFFLKLPDYDKKKSHDETR